MTIFKLIGPLFSRCRSGKPSKTAADIVTAVACAKKIGVIMTATVT